MSTYKKLIDLVSLKKTPRPSKEFWLDFDRELARRLDEVDAGRQRRRFSFGKIKYAFRVLLKSSIRPALAAAFLMTLIIGGTLLFKSHQEVQFYSLAAMSNDALTDELVTIEEVLSLIDNIP